MKLLAMALLTFQFRMRDLELPPGAGVIECFPSFVAPGDQGEVATCMLRMAGSALLASLTGMEATFLIDQPGDILVALQAKLGHSDVAAAVMTPIAVAKTLEFAMGIAERPGGDLRVRGRR